jgi:hypothetical protein
MTTDVFRTVAHDHIVDAQVNRAGTTPACAAREPRRREVSGLTWPPPSVATVCGLARRAIADRVPMAGCVQAGCDTELAAPIVLSVVAWLLSIDPHHRPAFETQLIALGRAADPDWREIGELVRAFAPEVVAACRCKELSEERVMRHWRLVIGCVPTARHLVAGGLAQLARDPQPADIVAADAGQDLRGGSLVVEAGSAASSGVTPINARRRPASEALARMVAGAVIDALLATYELRPISDTHDSVSLEQKGPCYD